MTTKSYVDHFAPASFKPALKPPQSYVDHFPPAGFASIAPKSYVDHYPPASWKPT